MLSWCLLVYSNNRVLQNTGFREGKLSNSIVLSTFLIVRNLQKLHYLPNFLSDWWLIIYWIIAKLLSNFACFSFILHYAPLCLLFLCYVIYLRVWLVRIFKKHCHCGWKRERYVNFWHIRLSVLLGSFLSWVIFYLEENK